MVSEKFEFSLIWEQVGNFLIWFSIEEIFEGFLFLKNWIFIKVIDLQSNYDHRQIKFIQNFMQFTLKIWRNFKKKKFQ